MSVLAIHNLQIDDDDYWTVEALVEDSMLVCLSTHDSPAEYAAGVCEARFIVDPKKPIPVDEDDFCSYLDSLNLDWRLVEVDNSDLDV
jgi:hypothetical protein